MVTRVILRVHPLPAGTRTLTISTSDSDEMQQLILDLLGSNLNAAAIQARAARDQGMAVDIGLEGSQAGLAAQEAQIRAIIGVRKNRLAVEAGAEAGAKDFWGAREALFTASRALKTACCAVSASLVKFKAIRPG